jgi:hypothetical protein
MRNEHKTLRWHSVSPCARTATERFGRTVWRLLGGLSLLLALLGLVNRPATARREPAAAYVEKSGESVSLMRVSEKAPRKVRAGMALLTDDKLTVPAGGSVAIRLAANGKRFAVHGANKTATTVTIHSQTAPYLVRPRTEAKERIKVLTPLPTVLLDGGEENAHSGSSGTVTRNTGRLVAVVGLEGKVVRFTWTPSAESADAEARVTVKAGAKLIVSGAPEQPNQFDLNCSELKTGQEYEGVVTLGDEAQPSVYFRLSTENERKQWTEAQSFRVPDDDPTPYLPDLLRFKLYDRFGLQSRAEMLALVLLKRTDLDEDTRALLTERTRAYAEARRFPSVGDQ